MTLGILKFSYIFIVLYDCVKKLRRHWYKKLQPGIPIVSSQSTSKNITFPSHSGPLKIFFNTYSYGLRVAKHDELVSFMIRGWQSGQKN